MTVGFAIPSIPPRRQLLTRAISSIVTQTHPVEQISVAVDNAKAGAGPTRNRAKDALRTEWTCFLDDDDELLPHHVQHLLARQAETGADVVFPWFDVVDGGDPFPMFRGREWSVESPHSFPITALVRTEVAQSLPFDDPMDPSCGAAGEDFAWWVNLALAGAKIVHTPEITWRWYHNSGNTAGLPSRW